MSNADRTVEIDDEDTTPETWGFAHEDPSLIVDANHLPVGRAAHPGSLDAHKLAAAGEMYDILLVVAGGLPRVGGEAWLKAFDDAKMLVENVRALNYG